MSKKEKDAPSVGTNQWHHVNWWHYCEPKGERVAYRSDIRSFDLKEGKITIYSPIECGTCHIKGKFIEDKWRASL